MNSVPEIRIRQANRAPVREERDYVLYWMVASRRAHYNFALQHAAARAEKLGVGLVVVELARMNHKWVTARSYQFVIDGMVDNQHAFEKSSALYYPYVEPEAGDGAGMLTAFAERAAVVVCDDAPIKPLPEMASAAAALLDVRMELVDSNGLYPLRATSRLFSTAASFRRHLQRELPDHLAAFPAPDPLAGRSLPAVSLGSYARRRWPAAKLRSIDLSKFRFDLDVAPTPARGGARSATARLQSFLRDRFTLYASQRNHPEAHCESDLSPYLHHGHISAHQLFMAIAKREEWSPERLAEKPNGSRTGWWGVSEPAEAFFDQFITWRELCYNAATHDPHYRQYRSLPDWAQRTLAEHEGDQRPILCPYAALENAHTPDPLWNAAQNQLVRDGTIHNYLRMLWGKKILEWSTTPQVALAHMIELNNKFALDGCNPNSYGGIFWVLGRYDRPWGPERPIFGKIRYMTSANTARKLRLGDYLEKYGTASRERAQR